MTSTRPARTLVALALWALLTSATIAADPAAPSRLTTTQWDRTPTKTAANGLPILHSRPGAPVSLFLDFQFLSVDGKFTPYSLDKDDKTFDAREQEIIRIAWAKAAVAFSPFDVDVTTVEPDPKHPYIWEAISRGGGGGSSGTTGYVPLTGQKSTTGGARRVGGQNYKWCARAGGGSVLSGVLVHEAGHAQGIVGHEAYDEDGVYSGVQRAGLERGPFTRSVGPVGGWHVWLSEWGKPIKNPAGLFWVVNDIERITGEVVKAAKAYTDPKYDGDGFAPDDHGDDIAGAVAMVRIVEGLQAKTGVIERYDDTDMLSFDWPGGAVWIGVQTAVPVPLLDARATLYDAAGKLVAAADPAESTQVAMRIGDLPKGTYYLAIASDGDYGELGRYEATVSSTMPAALAPITHLSLANKSLADASGQTHAVAWIGTPQWAAGPDGDSAGKLDATRKIVVTPRTGSRFAAPGESPLGRTLSCRFKIDALPADGERSVLLVSGGRGGYEVYVEGGVIKAKATSPGGLTDWRGDVILTSPAPVAAGQWTHVALTHRTTFSKVDDTIALYVNGREVARDAAGSVPAAARFEIGGASFAGAVADIRILGEVPPANLIADWADDGHIYSRHRPTGGASALRPTVTHNAMTLTWADKGGPLDILRSVDNVHFTHIATVEARPATFTDTGLESSRQYFYAVRAIPSRPRIAPMPVAAYFSVVTRAAPVYRPRFIRVTKKDAAPSDWGYHRYGHKCEGVYGITLLWFGPHGHRDRTVRIERSTDDGKTFTPVITLPSRERIYYDTNLKPATKYTYRFVTIDDAGEAASIGLAATSAPAKTAAKDDKPKK